MNGVAWKTIGSTVLSNDGQWFGYRLAPQEGEAEIVMSRGRRLRRRQLQIGDCRLTIKRIADCRMWIVFNLKSKIR